MIDLYCGLGGWTDGGIAEGYDVVGFDLERHQYGEHRYPAQLVLQDVRTLHGSQFRDAALIVASPPCQEYSYMAMPWSKAKAIAAEYRSGARDVAKLTELFDACFRIQREASAASGRHVPMVVENVRGAIPWVGRSRWNYGSFHLWGDVPALMPMTYRGERKSTTGSWDQTRANYTPDHSWNGTKAPGQNWNRYKESGEVSPDWKFQSGGRKFTIGPKGQRDDPSDTANLARTARKAASAMIAKIPLPLSRYIARVWMPTTARLLREAAGERPAT